MADRVFTAGDSSGNWSTAANWSGATKPVDDDSVSIPPGIAYNITMGSDESDVDLASLEVHRDYTYTFGTTGNPIQCSVSLLRLFGSSGAYFEAGDNGAVAGDVNNAIVQLPTAGTPCELGTESGSTDGDWNRLVVDRGNVTCKTNIEWDSSSGELHLNGTGATVTVESGGGTALPVAYVNAGTLHCDSQITSLHIRGGTAYQDTAVIAAVYIYDGGTFVCNVTMPSATVFVMGGGTLDLTQDGEFKSLATVVAYPGARLLWSPTWTGTAGLHTATSFIDLRGM
jgi:hypothetical protein